MGTYLSTPIVTKAIESGEAQDCSVTPLAWGVVDMQGWRKTMEDAHVAQTDVDAPPHVYMDDESRQKGSDAKVFGVFDGHGGPEVARFCQLYMVDVLTKQAAWVEESPEKEDPNDPSSSAVGQALVSAFHSLDRMIDDKTRREELTALRMEKPPPSERRTTDTHPIPVPSEDFAYPGDGAPASMVLPRNDFAKPASTTATEASAETATDQSNGEAETKSGDAQESEPRDEAPANAGEQEESAVANEEESKQDGEQNDEQDAEKVDGKEDDKPEGEPEVKPESEEEDDGKADDDSNEAVGHEEAAELDTDLLEPENDENEQTGEATESVTTVLNTAIVELNGDNTASLPETNLAARVQMAPTIIQNGRKICNLPDHPVHAGCTAVVAVLIGKTLTVANAGDSRAVLCRAGGRAEALSFDHKPHQEREMSRITHAGGFVNQFGRVNGNLNLSRSIGDLKYKQIPWLKPSEQMITAEPDILQVTLDSRDEFFILGCDGIWDCLTNDEAVKYVRDRIDDKPPTEIGAEMLDEIISEDPRATQGIGGDNMTVMIVDLQPHKRSYR